MPEDLFEWKICRKLSAFGLFDLRITEFDCSNRGCSSNSSPQGTDVLKEYDTGDSMYIISSGQPRIHRRKTTLRQRQVFGELSLLDAETRSTTATAKTYAVLFKIEVLSH